MTRIRRWWPAMAIALAACGGDGNGGQDPDDEGEPPVVGCTDGTLGASLIRVCFPADWNGGLVIYAHGYVQPDAPLAIPDDPFGPAPADEVITSLGYAYATTSYRDNGLVADLAVEDVADLEDEVRRTVRPDPTRVYLAGVSEGGLVAALAAERQGERYTGVLAACGPIGDFVRQLDYFNDVRVVFDYFFPGVIPGSAIEPPASVRSGWEATYAPAVIAALTADPDAMQELATVTGVPTAGVDAAGLAAAIAEVLSYNVYGSADVQDRVGGQPYDNAERVYAGSSNDTALNDDVARFTANILARASLSRYETQGSPEVEISILHTSGDAVVPFFHQVVYEQEVQSSGAGALLTRTDVDRFGHCNFSSDELLAAFSALPQ